jgi:hypothetical protein
VLPAIAAVIVVIVITPRRPRTGGPSVHRILIIDQSLRRLLLLCPVMDSEKMLQNACIDFSHRLVFEVLLKVVRTKNRLESGAVWTDL